MESARIELPARLAVVLKHVRAVREVYEYINGDDIQQDVVSVRQILVAHLSHSVQVPDGWRGPYEEAHYVWLHPKKNWMVPSKDSVAVVVSLADPLGDDEQDSWVGLYIPSWKLRERFAELLRTIMPKAKEWKHVANSEPGETTVEFPVFRWIRYADFSGRDGFDITSFFQAISEAVSELVQRESAINQIFDKVRGANATSASK